MMILVEWKQEKNTLKSTPFYFQLSWVVAWDNEERLRKLVYYIRIPLFNNWQIQIDGVVGMEGFTSF